MPTDTAVCPVCTYTGDHDYTDTHEPDTDPPEPNGREYTCANPDGCWQALLTDRGYPIYGYRADGTPILDPADPEAGDLVRSDERTRFWYPMPS